MRVYIVDPSAVRLDRTHAAKSVLGHSRVLQAAGLEVHWITNEKSNLAVEGVRNFRIFPYTIYDDVRKKRGKLLRKLRAPIYRHIIARSSKRLVDTFLEESIGSKDHLFVPTSDWLLIQSIYAAFSDRRLKGRLPSLHLLIMYEQAGWMTGGYPYEKIVDLLKQHDSRLYLYTETRRHARRLAEATGKTVNSYPFPCFLDFQPSAERLTRSMVCFVGGGRRDKGFQMIPGIVRNFNEANGEEGVRFVVQAPRAEDGLDTATRSLRQYSNVEMLGNMIEESDYQDCLKKCSILVFPYLKNVYYSRGSAIVNEAVASETPFICTADTSLAEMIQQNNGECATNEREFSVAIKKILDNYDSYSKNASDMARRYRDQILNCDLVKNIKNNKLDIN